MSQNDTEPGLPGSPIVTQIFVYLIVPAAIALALAHVAYPEHIDETTAMFLAIALVTLFFERIAEFEGFGIKFEKAVEQAEKRVSKTFEHAFVKAEQQIGERVNRVANKVDDLWNSDPHKNKFGGSPEANGRRLTARMKPAGGAGSAGCKVRVRVESMAQDRPLEETVTFHLHPTFGRWARKEAEAMNGVAELTITSWGVFTIGVEDDDGETRLELDLSEVSGGTKKFYEN